MLQVTPSCQIVEQPRSLEMEKKPEITGLVLHKGHLVVSHLNNTLYAYPAARSPASKHMVSGLHEPWHMLKVTDGEHDSLVISDYHNTLHWVTVLVEEKEINLGSISKINLDYIPRGMCVTGDGQVVVCGYDTERLYKYSVEGECQGHIKLASHVRPRCITSLSAGEGYVISDAYKRLLWIREDGSTSHKVEGEVRQGHEVEGEVKTGREVEDEVKSGHEVEGEVKPGHEVEGEVKPGHEVKGEVKRYHEVENKMKSGHEVENEVKSGHEVEGEVKSGQEVEDVVSSGHEEEDKVRTYLHLRAPYDLIHDSQGHILVADYSVHQVLVFDQHGHCTGQLLSDKDGLRRPSHLLLDQSTDTLYVSCHDPVRVMIYRYSPLLGALTTTSSKIHT